MKCAGPRIVQTELAFYWLFMYYYYIYCICLYLYLFFRFPFAKEGGGR